MHLDKMLRLKNTIKSILKKLKKLVLGVQLKLWF